ncbi:SLC4A11 [Cordylochernes scorpioides]|uniref:SLC4A11 n=1 Tax=Cordylochernes scorpioides TaxID=51811 RepID=A0ABY6KCY7_9ARAC|nr:SLC4A11 [Cordylochernes scorpioides]
MRETTTRKTIEQLRRLFSSYGLPEELVSDNGPQFTGSEMKGFLEGNGIKQTLIPAYHPQSNGLAERAVRTIKTALDKNKRKIGDTIQDTLSKVLLAYRSTPHVTTGKTPSELFIGRALRTRVSLIHPSLASRVRDQQARQMKYDRRTHLEEFQIDDLVWCKNFRGGDKWIPGKIVGKKGTRVYTILIHGQVKAYHRDQIRKRWRNGEEDESGDGERQPEHSRGAGPSAIISEVVRDRGYMESLSPGLTSQRSDQDSEVQSDTDDGKSLEPLRSLDPEALKEEGPVLRRNPPRARRPPPEIDIHNGGRSGQVHLLSRTIQGTYVSEGGGFDYDQSWICAMCNLATIQKRHVAIARLKHSANMGRTSHEVRFFILVLTPSKEKGTKNALETGRTFATIFADMEFRQRLLEVHSEAEFKSVLLKHAQDLAAEQSNPGKRHPQDYEVRGGGNASHKCRVGRGLFEDIRRRVSFYTSDYVDGPQPNNTLLPLSKKVSFDFTPLIEETNNIENLMKTSSDPSLGPFLNKVTAKIFVTYASFKKESHRKRRHFKQTDAFTRGMVIGLKRAARVDRRILRQAVAAPQATCTAILQHVQDTLDHSISTRTISRRLVANGLHSCRPLRRLPLTPPNRRQRLEWCRARLTWMTEWHRVVFSDESRFCLSSDSRRVRVWRRRGERSNSAAIVERPTVRQRVFYINALYLSG